MFSASKSAAVSSGYRIANSLRFRSSASAYLNRTPSTAGNRQTWTWSAWVKRGALGAAQILFGAASSPNGSYFRFESSDALRFYDYNGTTFSPDLITTQVFRDPSAWYHVVLVSDTTNATAANRVRLYVNGTQVTAFSTATYPAQNANNTSINNTYPTTIGAASATIDGYLADINFIDGQALTPSSFGQISTTTGVWGPKSYTGTYGTNGFKLNFSNGTSTTTLGYDSSGNGNNWTTNNISLTAGSTYDWMIDSPTPYQGSSYGVGNYCTWNPLRPNAAMSYSNGNLSATSNGGSGRSSYGTFGMASSKWYFELTGGDNTCGISTVDDAVYAYYQAAGSYNINGSITSGKSTYTTTDVIGCAYDADTNTIEWFKNNVSQGTISFSAASGKPVVPIFSGTISVSRTCIINAGQRPFAYTPPTGYKALNTQNLPAPSIVNGAAYMAATTYTGTGASLSVSNASFQPDLVWIKSRSAATDHALYDVIRGTQNRLESNTTDAAVAADNGLTAFNSNGFTVNTLAQVNTNAATYVGWQWKAGGTAVTNTAGSITSSVSANTTSGFSVVTYTGTGSAATIGHGLGVAPSMIIVKSRTNISPYGGWPVYHVTQGNNKGCFLNTTAAVNNQPNLWNSTTPTSSVFSIGTDQETNYNTANYVAYCFAAIAGYSAFGSYTGNGSADGPFVYLGFRPKFILIKNATTGATNWLMDDTSRGSYNVVQNPVFANAPDAEQTSYAPTDILCNGFKVRAVGTQANNSGDTFIYACFAENPFKYSLAR